MVTHHAQSARSSTLKRFNTEGTDVNRPPVVALDESFGAAALASGQITGAEGEKYEAGELGDYTIGAKGEVVLGPPTVFTKDNIDKFDF